MKLLVTGGAGYIGSVCTRALLDRGHEVVVLDTLENGHRQAVDRRAHFVLGSTGNPGALTKVFSERIDGVLHFAAYLDVAESVREPQKYVRNNVENGKVLLVSMKKAGVSNIVFSSTCATYGVPKTIPITEEEPQLPINPYGETKLAFERLLDAGGFRSVKLRYFNAAGAAFGLGEDHRPEIHLLPLTLSVALGKMPCIKVFGTDYPTPDGTCVRDYIHVQDLADAHVRAIEALEKGISGAFNLGTGRGSSVLEVIKASRKVTGHPIPAVMEARRPGDPPYLVASSRKARKQLGWKPRFSLRDIVSSAWEWHQANPGGYAD